jgi:hypothetical protein
LRLGFVVMHAANRLGRDFIGCDITASNTPPRDGIAEAA